MPMQWRCTLCGECCKQYVPLVLPEDVKRIQRTLNNRPLSTFITFYLPDDFNTPLDDQHAALLFQTRHGPVAMGLSREERADGGYGCTFLNGDNSCSIQGFKPLVCRQYPFRPVDYEDEAGPYRVIDNPCFGRHATDETVPEAPVRLNYQTFSNAQEAYLERVRQWNADPVAQTKEIADFLSFVGLEWS